MSGLLSFFKHQQTQIRLSSAKNCSNYFLKKINEPERHSFSILSATSFNHRLLLTGQVPDEATRTKVEAVVRPIPDVRTVFNETVVSGATSFTSAGNDASLTTQVKARMLQDNRVPSIHVKVVTEAGVVYLMGLLTHAEADAATEVARGTSGVTKVVKLFEYIN